LFESEEAIREFPDANTPILAERIDASRMRQRLSAALEELPPFLSAIVNLHYIEQMKLAQIAEVFNRDARSIAVSLHRARLKLREILLSKPGGEAAK
jgi:RNA polymerase sigma factor (sigma-70 family)